MDDWEQDEFDWDEEAADEAFEDRAYARNTDPETSHSAAESLKPKAIAHLESIFAKALRQYTDQMYHGRIYYYGLTCHEIAYVTGERLNTISPRTAPMVRKGLICDTGHKRTWHGSEGTRQPHGSPSCGS